MSDGAVKALRSILLEVVPPNEELSLFLMMEQMEQEEAGGRHGQAGGQLSAPFRTVEDDEARLQAQSSEGANTCFSAGASQLQPHHSAGGQSNPTRPSAATLGGHSISGDAAARPSATTLGGKSMPMGAAQNEVTGSVNPTDYAKTLNALVKTTTTKQPMAHQKSFKSQRTMEATKSEKVETDDPRT